MPTMQPSSNNIFLFRNPESIMIPKQHYFVLQSLKKIHLNLMQCCSRHTVAKNITIKAGKSFKSQHKKMGKWELQKISASSKFSNGHETFYSLRMLIVSCFTDIYYGMPWAYGCCFLVVSRFQKIFTKPPNQPSVPSSLVPVLLR